MKSEELGRARRHGVFLDLVGRRLLIPRVSELRRLHFAPAPIVVPLSNGTVIPTNGKKRMIDGFRSTTKGADNCKCHIEVSHVGAIGYEWRSACC